MSGRIVLAGDIRRNLAALVAEQDQRYAVLDRVLGRGRGYVARFVRSGVPAFLTDADASTLARFFGADPRLLGLRN